MLSENLHAGRGSCLRRNSSRKLNISINSSHQNKIMTINGNLLTTKIIQELNMTVNPYDFYMIINIGSIQTNVQYDQNITGHEIIYDPYKYEDSEKNNFNPEIFISKYQIPEGYIDILSKWYSIKFTFPEYNLIFIRPEMGISIQTHSQRSETWEILAGKPIVINNNKVFYFVDNGAEFTNEKLKYHSIINPNKNAEDFVILKEKWSGYFDEDDIKRVFNPNHYN